MGLTKLYLDIDGVILTKDGRPAEGAEPLLDFILKHFDCYWLTTHCRHGVNKTQSYLSQYFPTEFSQKFLAFKETDWTDLKTEAIDLESEFFWLEDYPLSAEFQVLMRHDKIGSLLKVDLTKADELNRVLSQLKLYFEKQD